MLLPMICPNCSGELKKIESRIWQCAYCFNKYTIYNNQYLSPVKQKLTLAELVQQMQKQRDLEYKSITTGQNNIAFELYSRRR